MKPIVECRHLVKHFQTSGGIVQAVDDVSFSIDRCETVGLVGESGCGKSTIGRTMLKLVVPTGGELLFEGKDIFKLTHSELAALREKMGIVFQNPYSSLNPRMKVLDIVGEPIRTFRKVNRAIIRETVATLLEQVGLKGDHLHRFPHQFSGGQRQRIAIARSLALGPNFLVLDEPTSALDVSVQAQVLNLIRELQHKNSLTYLFITHDLDVVKLIADRILVMYLGKLVESGPVETVFSKPKHPYTKALISAIPNPDPLARKERILIEGDIPSPIDPPKGCRFHSRCPLCEEICLHKEPDLKGTDNHFTACHMVHV